MLTVRRWQVYNETVMKNTEFYLSKSNSPYFNLAAEEVLTRDLEPGKVILFLWQNRDTVVFGKNQNCFAECNIAALTADGGFPARRLSGGGTVFHDLNNLCFSFIADEEDYSVSRQLSVIADACRSFGIDIVQSGRNDLLAGGAKFSGNAFYRIGRNRCHHGTLLISSDLTRLGKYLTVSESKLRAKGIASVRSRVCNLCEYAPGLTPAEMTEALLRSFEKVYGMRPEIKDLPQDGRIEEREKIFSSPEWIYGSNPDFSHSVSRRFPWGEVTVGFCVDGGRISDCRVTTDALEADLAGELESALKGVLFAPEAIEEAVSGFSCGDDLKKLFSDI